MEKYDVLVVGGGVAGYSAALRAGQLGARVALVEHALLGGTCLNRGCIPTKTLIAGARLLDRVKRSAELGLRAENAAIDYSVLAGHKDAVVAKLRAGLAQLLKAGRVTVLPAKASFLTRNRLLLRSTAPNGIASGETEIEGGRVVIATGSVPAVAPGLAMEGCVDSDGFLSLSKLPESMIVLGGGVIGCEFACMAAQLGVRVTVVEMLEDIVAGLDVDVRRELRRSMEGRLGIRIITGRRLENVRRENGEIAGTAAGEAVRGNLLVAAVGRKPATAGLGLANAGVKTTEAGYVVVDEACRTSAATVYAAGDVTGGPQLAHAAMFQGVTAAENACLGLARPTETIVPMCIFTEPEVAAVGMTEEEAARRGIQARVGRFAFAGLGRAVLAGEAAGFVKLVADAETGRLLGAAAIGAHATELIAEAAVAVRSELTAEELARTMHAHPTFAEAWMEAAGVITGTALHAPARRPGK